MTLVISDFVSVLLWLRFGHNCPWLKTWKCKTKSIDPDKKMFGKISWKVVIFEFHLRSYFMATQIREFLWIMHLGELVLVGYFSPRLERFGA